MGFWRSLKSLLLVALLVSASTLAWRAAAAQTPEAGSTGTAAATGSGAEAGREFRKDLPTDVPEAPLPPVVRPQGSFFSLAVSRGGALFWVLVVLMVGAVLVALERLVALYKGQLDVSRFMGDVGRGYQEKGVNGAMEVCSRYRGPVVQVVMYGLQRAARGPEAVEKAVATACLSNVIGMRRGMGILNFVGQTAPLVGFLGTAMALLKAFDAATATARVEAAQAIGGLAEAFVAATSGIAVAILVNVVINLIAARIDKLSVQMEEAGDELVDVIAQSQSRVRGRTA